MLLRIFSIAIVLSLSGFSSGTAGDSTSVPQLQPNDIGFQLPDASRSTVSDSALRANRATTADNAERAKHADTASALTEGGEETEVNEPGLVCGPSGQRCGNQVKLPPGSYMVNCSYGGGEDRDRRTKFVAIFAGGGGQSYASCQYNSTAKYGVRGSPVHWVQRL